MVQEKSDIEKRLEQIPLALRNKIEIDALYDLANESWCKKHGILFEKEFNPEENSGFVRYSDERQRMAVEILYLETIERERREALEMYDYRKRLPRGSALKSHVPENEVLWYL